MRMERQLKRLFDYQHFQNNKHLAALIAETEVREEEALSDELLSFVNAAGAPEATALPMEENPLNPGRNGHGS